MSYNNVHDCQGAWDTCDSIRKNLFPQPSKKKKSPNRKIKVPQKFHAIAWNFQRKFPENTRIVEFPNCNPFKNLQMKIAGTRSSCGSKSRLEIYENLDITHKGFLLGIKCIAPHASGNVRYLNMIWNLWRRTFSNTDQYGNKVNWKMWEISAFSVEWSLQTPCRGLPGSRLRFETRRDGLPKDSRSCAKPRDY